MNRNTLLYALKKLSESQFVEVIFRFGMPLSYMAHKASQVEQAIELVRYSEQLENGLEKLDFIIQSVKSTSVDNNYLPTQELHTIIPTKNLNRVRTIFIGYGETGKTSLIRALNGRTVTSGQEDMTPGIEISEWLVPNTEIVAHFWDFGGQVMAHATHQFFMRAQCLYVLLLNARNDINANQQAEYWLEHVRAFGGESPIMVVGNKADLAQVNIDMLRLQDKYPNIIGFYPISCIYYQEEHYRIGFERFKDDFINQLSKLDQALQARFEDKHFAVLEELRERSAKDAFLSKGAFDRLCTKHKISKGGPLDREWLLRFLDNLGEIVYFPRLATLDDFILNPRWLTYGVYTLLFSKQAKNQAGKLSETDVVYILGGKTIFDNKNYKLTFPAKRCRFIVDAMIAFDLCYRIPNAFDEFILPDLLPSDRPKTLDFNRASALRFDFDFEGFLPRHVICNLIVRRHTQIFADMAWQNGVHLKHGSFDTEALVETDYQARRLSLWIKGQHLSHYFSILYDDITEILDRMRDLEHEEWIHLPTNGSKNGGGRAPFKTLLVMERLGEQRYVSEYGVFNVVELLKIMPAEKRQEESKMVIEIHGNVGNIAVAGRDMENVDIGNNLQMVEILTSIKNLIDNILYDLELEDDSADKRRAEKELENAEKALQKLEQSDERDSGLKTLTTFVERVNAGTTTIHKLFENVSDVGKKLGELAAKITLLLG